MKTEIIILVDYLQNLQRNKIPVRSCFTELWFLKFFELFVRVPCQATQVNWVSETFAEKFGIWKGGIFDIGYFFKTKVGQGNQTCVCDNTWLGARAAMTTDASEVGVEAVVVEVEVGAGEGVMSPSGPT